MNYIVYTEIIEDGHLSRWYYGTYSHERANQVAEELGQNWEDGIFHGVCPECQAENWEIENLPT